MRLFHKLWPGNQQQGRQKTNNTREAPTNESSPLMSRDVELGQQSLGTHDEHPLLRASPPQQKKRNPRIEKAWGTLAQRIREGDLLLQSDFQPVPEQEQQLETAEDRRQQVQQEIRSAMDFTLGQCLLAILAYLGVAVFAFSYLFEHWSLIDSMYFAVVTFTTIGYGDLTPDTHASRLFTSFFALSGVAFLGIALGVLGNNMIEAQEKAVQQTGDLAKYRVLSLFGTNHSDEKDNNETNNEAAASSSWCSTSCFKLLAEFAGILFFLKIFSSIVADDPGIDVSGDWSDSLYFAIITACTVGYGDLAPQSQKGRLAAIFFIPLVVGTMGHFLSVLANWVIESRQTGYRQLMANKELTLQDLEVMDEDGDGNVTQAEWLEFMLVAMDKVDKELIQELKGHFHRLDEDGTGTLSREDLVAAARRKLQSPRRKLELSSYKQKLIRQARIQRQRRQQQQHTRDRSFFAEQLSFIPAIFSSKDDVQEDEATP